MKQRKQPILASKKFSETTTTTTTKETTTETKERQKCNKEEGMRRAAERVPAHKERRTEQSRAGLARRSLTAATKHAKKTRKNEGGKKTRKATHSNFQVSITNI
jgi:hypothetical protein